MRLARQMSARLTCQQQDRSEFARHLSNLILRCTRDHPYHVVPVLLALANAGKDEQMLGTTSKSKSTTPPLDDRGKAALDILKKLKCESALLRWV